MVDFRAVIQKLIDIGFYEIFLPFLLVYSVVFAILQKSKIFEGGSSDQSQAKNVNAIVAFVFGLFVIASIQTVKHIQSLIVNIVLIVMFLLTVLVVLGFLFGEGYKNILDNTYVKWGLSILVFLVALGILLSMLGVWDWIADWWDSLSGSSDTFSTLFVMVIIGFILYWITKSDGSSAKSE